MTTHYMSLNDIAQWLNTKQGTVARYNLPTPDAYIGTTRGWLLETICEWDQNRPGHGGRHLTPTSNNTSKTPEQFLSVKDIGQLLNLPSQSISNAIRKNQTPEPDAIIGTRKGWKQATIQTWATTRRTRTTQSLQ